MLSTTLRSALLPGLIAYSLLQCGLSGAADTNGLTGTYYPREDFTGTPVIRVDQQVNFDWGSGTPISTFASDRFSIVWSGQVKPTTSETYTFYTTSDDGIAVWVNGRRLINNFTQHAATENSGTIALTAGQKYNIVIKYYEYKGNACAKLSWSSPSIAKQIIPTTQLFSGMVAESLALVTPPTSRTNPAWLEGISGEAAGPVSVKVSGVAVQTVREGTAGWYAKNSASGQPAGIVLPNTGSVPVLVTANQQSLSSTLSWAVTDLASLPYGMERIVIRPGDKLLLSVGGTGTNAEIDTNFTGTFVPRVTGAPGTKFPTTFSTSGTFALRARRDGVEVGRLTVVVPNVGFAGPIADHIGFIRGKTVTVTPEAAAPDVMFRGDDQLGLIAGTSSITGANVRLSLLAVSPGRPNLQARIGDEFGPLLAQYPIDVFSLHSSAEKSVKLISQYPDGSLLTQGRLTMDPLVRDLSISMHVFISGVTFANSTLDMQVSTNAFSPDGLLGIYDYGLIQSPGGYYHLCHTIQVTQNGEVISP